MIGVLERKGQAYGGTKRLRTPTMDDQDIQRGKELRAKIYSGVGNSGIFSLMDKYLHICGFAVLGCGVWAVWAVALLWDVDLCELPPAAHSDLFGRVSSDIDGGLLQYREVTSTITEAGADSLRPADIDVDHQLQGLDLQNEAI
jgi:hypothetical protein